MRQIYARHLLARVCAENFHNEIRVYTAKVILSKYLLCLITRANKRSAKQMSYLKIYFNESVCKNYFIIRSVLINVFRRRRHDNVDFCLRFINSVLTRKKTRIMNAHICQSLQYESLRKITILKTRNFYRTC